MTTRREARAALLARGREAGLARSEVERLFLDVLDLTLSASIAHPDERVPDDAMQRLDDAMARRLSGEPLQYIAGFTEFYGRRFAVDERVLIPRPETELLCEELLRRAPMGSRVLDIGTGSGCVAVTVDIERRDLDVIASDRSVAALAVARENARALGSGVKFFGSDLANAFRGEVGVVVSNPPYIPAREIDSLQQEVRDHEPVTALTPGESGLEIIERLFREMRSLLRPGGLMLLEIGHGQAAEVESLAQTHGWKSVEIRPDLAGIPRVVIASR